MASISVEVIGASKVGVFLDTFPKQTAQAIARALKRGRERAQTRANRVISADMGLKVSDVRKRIRVIESDFAFELRGSLKRIPLIEFGARGPEPSRGKGRGVSYRIGRGGRGRQPHGFIATTKSGHSGVFRRAGQERLPIQQLFGPSVGRVMIKHESEIASVGVTAYEKELDRLLDRIIQGGVGNAG